MSPPVPVGEPQGARARSLDALLSLCAGAAGLLLAIAVAVGVLAVVGLDRDREALVERYDPALLDAQQLRAAMIDQETGLRGYARNAAYTASKHAVIGLSRAAAKEEGHRGVRVNAICPGVVDTAMHRATEEKRGKQIGEISKPFKTVGLSLRS